MLDIKHIIWATWCYLQIKYFLIAFFLPQMTHFYLLLFLTRFDKIFTLLFHEFIYHFSGFLLINNYFIYVDSMSALASIGYVA